MSEDAFPQLQTKDHSIAQTLDNSKRLRDVCTLHDIALSKIVMPKRSNLSPPAGCPKTSKGQAARKGSKNRASRQHRSIRHLNLFVKV
jgi:hypothetical protein